MTVGCVLPLYPAFGKKMWNPLYCCLERESAWWLRLTFDYLYQDICFPWSSMPYIAKIFAIGTKKPSKKVMSEKMVKGLFVWGHNKYAQSDSNTAPQPKSELPALTVLHLIE